MSASIHVLPYEGRRDSPCDERESLVVGLAKRLQTFDFFFDTWGIVRFGMERFVRERIEMLVSLKRACFEDVSEILTLEEETSGKDPVLMVGSAPVRMAIGAVSEEASEDAEEGLITRETY